MYQWIGINIATEGLESLRGVYRWIWKHGRSLDFGMEACTNFSKRQ